jgi:predicted HicB family RNase H-like nuclease
MKDKINYKDFIGSVHYSDEDDVFFGKIESINDLVTFEGSSVVELRKAFADAVDDYLDICEQTSKNPLKSYKGSFNIRISSELHRKIAEKAMKLGVPLNKVIQNAIEREVNQSKNTHSLTNP